MEDIETTLDVEVEITPDDDPENVREVLDALLDAFGVDSVDVEVTTPFLYACIDCSLVRSTGATVRITEEEPDANADLDSGVAEDLVTLSHPCPVCGSNAHEELEIEVAINGR